MIEVVLSKNGCPHCAAQRAVMSKSFFDNEYRIIEAGSPEFDALDVRESIDGVPFVIVRDDETSKVKYAKKGLVEGTLLRQIERLGAPAETVFNLREARQKPLAVAAWTE